MQQKQISKIFHMLINSSLALKSNWGSLKPEVEKLDIDKLVPVLVDLSKLSDVVKMTLLKKMNDKLVEKVNNIDISGLVPKTKYDADKSDLEKKVPDTSGLVKKTDCNTKSTEIEKKIPSISGLASNSTLTALEDKIPNVSNLVKKKTDYDTKITETEKKNLLIMIMINILLPQNLTVFTSRLAQADLITKTGFDEKLKSLN